MSRLDVIKRHYPDLIAVMLDDFDSHDLIFEVIARHSHIYDSLLNIYDANDDRRVGKLHRNLSTCLNSFPELVQRNGNSQSMNVHGYKSKAARWRRI
jgi:hypothetical protein